MKKLCIPFLAMLILLAGCQSNPEALPSPIKSLYTDGLEVTHTETLAPTLPVTVTETTRPTMTSQPTKTPNPLATPTQTEKPSATPEPVITMTPMATRIWNDSVFSLWAEKNETILSLKWSLDGKFLFAGTRENGMASFDMLNRRLMTYVGNGASIYALAVSPDGEYIAAALGIDGSIRLLSMTSGALLRTIWPAHENPPQAVAFSPNSSLLLSCGLDDKVKIWDVETGELKSTLYEGASCTDMQITPDGRKLVVAFGYAELVRVWDTSTWQELYSFPVDRAEDIVISPDGNRLVTAGGIFSREANVWDLETGELLFTLGGHPSWVWAVAYSPDGKLIATGGVGENVYLWDANTGQPIYELYTEPNYMQALEFSPDGIMLAAGGSERIWVWDITKLENSGAPLTMK